MKILEIDYDYYCLPQDVSCVEEFIEYANRNYSSFVKLTRFETDNCVFPYLIAEETTEVYINLANVERIKEAEATVLTRAEYDARLTEVVKVKCLDCVNYTEDLEGDNLEGHRGKISLDGKCWAYRKKNG